MSLLFGAKFLQQSATANRPHILGFNTARGAANDTLLELWNGPTNTDRKMLVDLNGKLYSAALTAGDLLYAVTGGVTGVRRLDSLPIGTAYHILRVNSGATAPEWVVGPRLLTTDTTVVATSGTGEDNLTSYTLPANTLAVNGQSIRITAYGTQTGDAGNKTVRLYFGGLNIGATPVPDTTHRNWSFACVLTRTTTTDSILVTVANVGTNSATLGDNSTAVSAPSGVSHSGTIIIKCTGQCVDGADTITQYGLVVEHLG
jgi:hypothetical protein